MKLYLIILLIPILVACSTVGPQIAKWDDTNAANTVIAAKQIMRHEEMNSAAIRQIIGTGMDKLPLSFSNSLDALDKFATTYGKDQSGMTEKDAGQIVVIAGQMVDPVITAIFQQYFPDVWARILKYLPSFISL